MQIHPINIEIEHPSQKSYSLNKSKLLSFIIISLVIMSIVKVFV